MARLYHLSPDLSVYSRSALILNGENDAAFRRGEAKFVSAAQHGRVQAVPDAGHACNLDQPEKYDQAVRDFAHSIRWTSSIL